jgi:hypothetical protein
MPRYKPSPDEEALYSGPVKPPGGKAAPAVEPGAPPGQETPPGKPPGEPKTTDEEIGQEQHSAVVDNKVLTGPDGQPPEEGAEIVVTVVKNFGEESEIRYAPKVKPGAEESPLASVDSEIDAMDQKETA